MSPRKRSEKKRSSKASTEAVPDAAQPSEDETEPSTREVSSVDEIAGVNAEAAEATEAGAVASDAAETGASEAAEDAEAAAATDDEPLSDEDAELQAAAEAARPSAAPEPVAAPATREHLKRVIESLVFASEQIISAQQIARIVKSKAAEIRELMPEIMREWEGRGIELIEVANGYQFRSAAASAPFVRDLVSQRPVRLTRAQLETLALVAYRQPITRPEIDDVRGVDSGSAIKVLLERGLLKILGRKDEAGRPLLYGTTPYFLEFFGMKSMSDLPTLREFTDLTEEHRELFKKKMGEVPDDLGAVQVEVVHTEVEEETIDDEELMAIAEAAKAEADDRGTPIAEPPSISPSAAESESEPESESAG
jgi:segregation and condensation protein B